MTGSYIIHCTILVVTVLPVCTRAAQPSLTLKSTPNNPTYVNLGKNLTLNVTYRYNGTFGVDVEWLKGTNRLIKKRADGRIISYPASGDRASIKGLATLVLINIKLQDNGTYSVKLDADDAPTQLEFFVGVIVVEKPNANVSCSSDIIVKEGRKFSCLCEGVNGSPPPYATWSKNGKVINGNGYLSKELSLKNVASYDSGNYTCTVKSHDLEDTQVIQLLVKYSPKDVSIGTNISSGYVEVNTTVAIICTADAFPKANYTISHNGTTLPSGNGVYIINSVKFSDRGRYDCVAENIIEKTSKSFQLNVKVRPKAKTSCNVANVVNESNAFTCLCESIGGYPRPNAFWTKVGQDVVINGVGYLKKTLSFNSISRNDTGNYSCEVQSLDLFHEITIQVLVQFEPELLSFKSNATDNSAVVGSWVKISWKANGYPRPKFALYKDTIKLQINVYDEEYIITSVNSCDAGKYECRAENNLGYDTKSFILEVTGATPPQRTSPPPNPKPGSSNCNAGIEWYIALIAFSVGLLVGVASVFAGMRLHRHLREREDGASTSPQEVGSTGGRPERSQNAVYQELDLKRMNEGDNYQSLRTNFRNARSNQAVDENEGGYQELNKIKERGDENYQSLNRV